MHAPTTYLQSVWVNLPKANLSIVGARDEGSLVPGQVDARNAVRGGFFAPQHDGDDQPTGWHSVNTTHTASVTVSKTKTICFES